MCFGTGGVNSLDLTRSILSGTPRRQITPGQIKSRVSTAADKKVKKKLEKLLRKPITEGRDREGGRERGGEDSFKRIWSFASHTLSPQYKGPNIFSGFSVAQS